LLRWLQDLEGADQILIDAHQGSGIVELPAIVGSREDGNQLPLREEFVSLLNHLMRTAHQIEVVLLAKDLNVIGAKGKGHSSFILSPPLRVLIGIGPQ
jgi:hypothetical protein